MPEEAMAPAIELTEFGIPYMRGGSPEVDEATQDTPENDPAASESEETPAPESTDSTPADNDGIDYKQRYDSLVPEYTRGQQLLAAARGEHGPEAQIQALQQLGVQVEAEEEEQEEDDGLFDPYEEIEGIKRQLAERQEAEEEANFQALETEYIHSTLRDLEQKEGVELSERDKKVVRNNALATRLEDGRPNLEGAFDDLMGIKSEARDSYIASKKAPKAPVGTAGSEKIDFSDPEKAKQWMVEDLEARLAAEEES